jgi:hypothetical protein
VGLRAGLDAVAKRKNDTNIGTCAAKAISDMYNHYISLHYRTRGHLCSFQPLFPPAAKQRQREGYRTVEGRSEFNEHNTSE